MSEEKTPSGQSKAGYLQAIDNYIYQIQQMVIKIESLPGDTMKNLFDVLQRGETYQQFGPQFVQMDIIVEVMAKEYGYSIDRVERDIDARMGERITELVLGGLFGDKLH